MDGNVRTAAVVSHARVAHGRVLVRLAKHTSSKRAVIAKRSPDTALRDITELLVLGIMPKSDSSGRSTYYEMKDPFGKPNSTDAFLTADPPRLFGARLLESKGFVVAP
jgi:hypothetical protein